MFYQHRYLQLGLPFENVGINYMSSSDFEVLPFVHSFDYFLSFLGVFFVNLFLDQVEVLNICSIKNTLLETLFNLFNHAVVPCIFYVLTNVIGFVEVFPASHNNFSLC